MSISNKIKKMLGLKSESAEEVKEMKKPKIGHIHLSGCTGCLMSLTENYDLLADLLDMVEIVYGHTLVDVWEMPEMDLALVEAVSVYKMSIV